LLSFSKKTNLSIYGNVVAFYNHTICANANHRSKNKNARKLNFYENIIGNQLPGGAGLIIREHAEILFPIPEHLKFEDWWVSYHLLKSNLVAVLDESVTLYRIHEGNDCASDGQSYESIKRDYLRHWDYLKEFDKLATTKKEIDAIDKARALREVFFGKRRYKYLMMLSFDKRSLMMILYIIFGAKRLYNLKDKLINS
jgi:hypothetical protein